MDREAMSPHNFSTSWARVATSLGLNVTWHALRHMHASQLIDAGVDMMTVSKRLSHASPTISMQGYAHLFRQSDEKAAQAINAALTGLG